MSRFLAKVVLTLEPSLEQENFHQALREISAHNKNNLLEMIGVDPIVYRTDTNAGTVDLQIWVTTITGFQLNQMILPFYYTGARKYIFMCSSKNALNFVKNAIDLTSDQINALNEMIILTKKGKTEIKISDIKNSIPNSILLNLPEHLEDILAELIDENNLNGKIEADSLILY